MSELTTQDACVTGSAPIAPEKINGKINLLDLTRKEMRQFFADMGEKPFRADQVMKWIYHYCYDDFDLMTDINKVLRTKLKAVAEIRAPEVSEEQRSADGTIKWAIRVGDQEVETVYIRKMTALLCVSLPRSVVRWNANSAQPRSRVLTATCASLKLSARSGVPRKSSAP